MLSPPFLMLVANVWLYSLSLSNMTTAFPVLPGARISNPKLATLSSSSSAAPSASRLFLFNKLGDAFKNDESLGKAPDAGLSSGPKFNQQVTVNDILVPGAVAGQKLTVVANKVRVRIPVNCQKGDCGTCMVSLNGRKVKACQTPLPAGKAVIKTL